MVRGSPFMCMRQIPARVLAAAASAPGSRQRAHVVDDVRASRAGGAHDFGFAGVDGNESGGFAPQRLDDGNDAREFFFERGRQRRPAVSILHRCR